MTGFLARSLAQQVAVASGISNLARAMTTQASAAAAGQSVPESEASTSQPSSETAIPAPSEPQSSSPSPPSEASNSPSSSPAPSQPASKRQPDMMETLLGKLKFNKTLKHDDDLSAEVRTWASWHHHMACMPSNSIITIKQQHGRLAGLTHANAWHCIGLLCHTCSAARLAVLVSSFCGDNLLIPSLAYCAFDCTTAQAAELHHYTLLDCMCAVISGLG